MLKVLSSFKNPKAMYKQEELHKLYTSVRLSSPSCVPTVCILMLVSFLQLLMSHDSSVQLLALKCLATYKSKSLLLYK